MKKKFAVLQSQSDRYKVALHAEQLTKLFKWSVKAYLFIKSHNVVFKKHFQSEMLVGRFQAE